MIALASSRLTLAPIYRGPEHTERTQQTAAMHVVNCIERIAFYPIALDSIQFLVFQFSAVTIGKQMGFV